MVVSVKTQQVKLRKPVTRYKKRINIKFLLIPLVIFLVIRIALALPKISFKREVRVAPTEILLPKHDIKVNLEHSNYNINSTKLYKEHSLSQLDKLSTLSIKYDVSISTILNVNGIKKIKDLDSIETLLIPDRDGFIYNVKDGDTLETIGEKFNIPKETLFSANRLKSYSIKELKELFIPLDSPKSSSITDKLFLYPVKGYISKRFGYHTNSVTGLTSLYQGLDFTSTNNEKIYSTKAGEISSIGYNANYGNYIFIDHWGGFRSLYAHLDRIDVEVGDRVAQEEVLGIMGDSGFTTRKKLFFCLMKNGKPVDPEKLLY